MLKIYPVAAFTDNYIWVGINTDTNAAFVVDPGDSQPVIDFLSDKELKLTEILITHHHADHTGGIKGLLNYYKRQIPVYSPLKEDIPCATHFLKEEDEINILNKSLSLKVLDIPGHTKGHIAYYNDNILFCGDTLFSAGCGRLFEGTPEQMFNSLSKLKHLKPSTKVYCAHEYTLSNLKFAKTIEPNNKDISNLANEVSILRKQNKPSLPSTIQQELEINPFLRTLEPEVIATAKKHMVDSAPSELDVFATIRMLKDKF